MDDEDGRIIKKISLIQTKILRSSSKQKLPPKKVKKMISEALCKDKEIYSYMEECSSRKQAKIMKVVEDLRNEFFKDPLKISEGHKSKQSVDTIDEEKEVLRIDASGFFSNRGIVFKETYIEYGKKKISYEDIKTVSYLATKKSINGIPTGTDYEFWLGSDNGGIASKLKKEEWGEIVGVFKQFIEPLLIQKIIYQIFEKGEEVIIGNVTLNNKGYSRNKFFGGIEEVLWKDDIFIPQYADGKVCLYKKKNDKGKAFTQIPMSTANSVLLPELIEACVAYFHHYKNSKKK